MLVPLLCDRKTKKCLASEHYPLLTPPADGAQCPTFWATLVNSESFVIVILVSLLCNSKTESCKSCLTAAYHPLLQMAPPATTYCTWPGSGFARMYSYFYVNGVHIQYDWQHSKIYCIEYRMSSSLFLYFWEVMKLRKVTDRRSILKVWHLTQPHTRLVCVEGARCPHTKTHTCA